MIGKCQSTPRHQANMSKLTQSDRQILPEPSQSKNLITENVLILGVILAGFTKMSQIGSFGTVFATVMMR